MTEILWGDVWWAEVPYAGRRPVVVLTRPEAIASIPVVLVAPATTNVRHLPTEVPLDVDDGMPLPCVINLDTPELLPKGILADRITRLGDARMMEICRALAMATNC
ncbi:MAG: type II toxin-antitoxin system PemK/MazF family toxin [Actinomycetota bacterium]|nr:type II toxin-antitoxin system PemK/MazF family toxin [Actinomycetota bacterium]